jgi:flap endonuclease-1
MPAEIRDAVGDVGSLRQLYLQPETTDDYTMEIREPDPDGIVRFLCDERQFSKERVTDALARAFPAPGPF